MPITSTNLLKINGCKSTRERNMGGGGSFIPQGPRDNFDKTYSHANLLAEFLF